MNLDKMVIEAQERLRASIETSAEKHLAEMKDDFAAARIRLGIVE